jgi:pimeloyl-ACP methyl ester carboxylesterase
VAATRRADTLVKPHRAYIDLAHGQVHYAECGDRAAPPVLLLHQTPRSWAEYREVLPLLGLRYRAIAMDTAGFGASDPPAGEASIEAWARIAAEFMQALGISGASVVGHHTGGVIAVELAARHAAHVGSLVLSSTPYTNEAFRRARADKPPIDAVEEKSDGSHLVQLWNNRRAFYPTDRPELLQAFVLDALKVTGDVEAGHRAVASYRMEEHMGRIDLPTLVIRATHDPFAAPHADEWRHVLPHAAVVDVQGGMVPLPDQMPREFAAAVMNFLDALP